MNAWRMLLRQSAMERSLVNEIWTTWGFLAIAAFAFIATLAGFLPRGVGAFVAAGFAAVVVIMWWGVFLQNAGRQNTPALAVLVPGLRRRLMALTAMLWLAGSLAPALLFGAAFGYFGQTLVVTAAMLLFIALCSRYVWLAFGPSIAIIATLSVYGRAGADAIKALTGWAQPSVVAAGFSLLLPVGVLVLFQLFPRGGDRHFVWSSCVGRRARHQRQGVAQIDDGSAAGLLLQQPFDFFYYSVLGRRGARRGIEQVLDGCGPRAHWSRSVLFLAVLTACALAWHGWSDKGMPRLLRNAFYIALLIVPILHVKGTVSAIKQYAGEQAVLRLVPSAPGVAALNRAIGLALLRRYAIVWITCAACSALIVAATPVSGAGWAGWLMIVALIAALAPLLMRDYARTPGWEWASMTMFGMLILEHLVIGSIGDWVGPAMAAAAVACMAATAIWLRVRWQRMVHGAPALPAGWLAA